MNHWKSVFRSKATVHQIEDYDSNEYDETESHYIGAIYRKERIGNQACVITEVNSIEVKFKLFYPGTRLSKRGNLERFPC